ncbi:MAG: hypothetical protein E7680_03315 [Ruminococcaceae bacterium]|nr:hypothetical protein [Oscillospiraceae bacterium]
MKKYHLRWRAVALFLAILLVLPLAACAGKQGKTLLTLDLEGTKVTFSVNSFQFLLSRLRGYFVRQGIANSAGSADEAAFWDVQGYFDETDTLKTWDTFYSEQVLENCKTYLVGLWIFEKNHLFLSESARANIDEKMNDLLTYQANGSKAKLNSILSKYGVNYDLLKSFYEIEAKNEAAMIFLYGENAKLLDATVKDPYLNANYFHYKRILFPFYETSDDENETIRAMTDEEKDEQRAKANTLFAELQGKEEAAFEAALTGENGEDEFTDGYYLPISGTLSSGTAEEEIREKLGTMKIGEIALLELSEGIQIVRRYEPTPEAYDLSVNAVWFTSFADNLMAELFAKQCKSYADKIVVNEIVFTETPKIKETEPNNYF